MQFVRGEALRLGVWGLLALFLFTTLPTLVLVAAVAVLFETIPFIRGGFGNIAYFVLYIVTIIVSLSGATVIGTSMLQAAHAAFPDRSLDFGVGYTIVEGPIQTFRWEGVTWTSDVTLGRLVWVGVALGITLLAALFFDCFDPARSKPKALRRNGIVTRVLAPFHSLRFPRLDLRRFVALPRLPLPPFGQVFLAELRLTLKGLRWWWYLHKRAVCVCVNIAVGL